MNWWILKQLRAMLLTDLREFVPQGYFGTEVKNFEIRTGIPNSEHFSAELRWGYLASQLGKNLFYTPDLVLSARQISASEVLMNLGMLVSAEAARNTSTELSKECDKEGIPDGNAGTIAQQLGNNHIPILSGNVKAALEQYLRHLSPTEAAPFMPLLDTPKDEFDDKYASFSDDAITHFHNLCSAKLAESGTEFAITQGKFLNEEAAAGRGIGGSGFAGRLAKLYAAQFANGAAIIFTNLKLAHANFGSPLAADVDIKLSGLASATLDKLRQGLDGAFRRYLSSLGILDAYPSGLEQRDPPQAAALSNQVTQYLWTLRNVPMKSPTSATSSPIFIFNAPVASVQTGAHAKAHIQQQWTQNESPTLADAFQQLKTAVLEAAQLSDKEKNDLLANLKSAEAELKLETPDGSRLLKWLEGVSAVIQIAGSAQPALEAVRAAARAFGLPV